MYAELLIHIIISNIINILNTKLYSCLISCIVSRQHLAIHNVSYKNEIFILLEKLNCIVKHIHTVIKYEI